MVEMVEEEKVVAVDMEARAVDYQEEVETEKEEVKETAEKEEVVAVTVQEADNLGEVEGVWVQILVVEEDKMEVVV